jgi:hypothetical protein
MRIVILMLVVAFCPIRSALAWGDTGHRIICEIALQELTDNARQRVKQLMRLDVEFSRLSDVCTGPDHPRQRADEHYVNLPRDAAEIDADECPLAGRCVLTAIDLDLVVLSSATASDQDQLHALKFLGHWIGDVHQPLHVSFEDDRGGNVVKVTGGVCGGNLHGVWDNCIIERGLNATVVANQLRARITDQLRSDWLASSPTDWPTSRSPSRPARRLATAFGPTRDAGMTVIASGWSPVSPGRRCWSMPPISKPTRRSLATD